MVDALAYRRSRSQTLRALLDSKHYRAVIQSHVYRRPLDTLLYRYVLGRGGYPTTIQLRVPGRHTIDIEIRSHFDLLTVQEIFLWRCYPCSGQERTILDLGANIGVSMLYFLTHAPSSFVVGFEPLATNLTQANRNLRHYRDRTSLVKAAVMDYDGAVMINSEPTGRYSGIGFKGGVPLDTPCQDVETVIHNTFTRRGQIDLLKIDVEGAEGTILGGMSKESYTSISAIAVEGEDVPFDYVSSMGFDYFRHRSGVHWFRRHP